MFGEMIQFDGPHIFQMGWFNHQLDNLLAEIGWFLEARFFLGELNMDDSWNHLWKKCPVCTTLELTSFFPSRKQERTII